ncbi:MAG: nuclear transport factor 2 family protein [Pseudomonadota bacterium]
MTTAAPAFAEEDKSLGQPITSENIVDVLEIQRVVTNLTLAVDTAKWDVVADLLEPELETTIGEPVNAPSVMKTEDEILARWRGFYESAERIVIHHVTSNERIYFNDADNADVYSKGVIVLENTPAGQYTEDGGMLRGYRWVNYEFGVTRTDAGWKVNKVNVEYLVQEFESFPPSN